jgi:hypothetical protein
VELDRLVQRQRLGCLLKFERIPHGAFLFDGIRSSAMSLRFSRASARASARVKVDTDPKPIFRGLPFSVYRSTHDRWFGPTNRRNPPAVGVHPFAKVLYVRSSQSVHQVSRFGIRNLYVSSVPVCTFLVRPINCF